MNQWRPLIALSLLMCAADGWAFTVTRYHKQITYLIIPECIGEPDNRSAAQSQKSGNCSLVK